MKFLVVDDNSDDVELLRFAFDSICPCEIIHLESAVTAMPVLSTRDCLFDLVLVDQRLPGLQGDELVRSFMANRDWDRRIPVVILSSAVAPSLAAAVEEAGAVIFEKPRDLNGYECLAHRLMNLVTSSKHSRL